MNDVVTLTLSLPTNGTRQDYLHCLQRAQVEAVGRKDYVSAMAITGLLQCVDEAIEGRRLEWRPLENLPALRRAGDEGTAG